MYFQMMKRKIMTAVSITVLALPVSAVSQDRTEDQRSDNVKFSDRIHKGQWEQGRRELTKLLKTGEDRDFYRRKLEGAGYDITSVNYDRADYLEYEVVKDNQTYEVQIDLDKNTHKAAKVDIAPNIWRAKITDQVLQGKKDAGRNESRGKENERYSDRDRKEPWDKGKDELADALKSGQERDFYRRELGRLGYLITSVNQDTGDYLEYEVVKDDQTYEVQIAMDKNTHKATKVDVTANMWKAESTKRVLESNQGRTGQGIADRLGRF